MSLTKQNAHILDSVITPAFADKLPPREPTIAELVDSYTLAQARWTLETDGLALEIGDEIRVRVMAELGLSKAQCDALSEAL